MSVLQLQCRSTARAGRERCVDVLLTTVLATVLGLASGGCTSSTSPDRSISSPAVAASLPDATPDYGVPAGWTPSPETYGVDIERNVSLTMSDGIKLAADVYHPTDPATGKPAAGPFPVILVATPYGKTFTNALQGLNPNGDLLLGIIADDAGAAPFLVKRGYIEVVLDERGTSQSQGMFSLLDPQQMDDNVTVINWAAKLPSSNGKVGMFGESYLALVQLLSAAKIGPNSPLKALFPIFPGNDVYRDLLTQGGGQFSIESGVSLAGGGYTLIPDLDTSLSTIIELQPVQLLSLLVQHVGGQFLSADGVWRMFANVLLNGDDTYDGDFWKARSPRYVLDKVVASGAAVYQIGGLWDVFQNGEPLNYAGLQNAAVGRATSAPMLPDQAVTGKYQTLIGPWYHLLPGIEKDLTISMRNISLAWFDHWLKDVPNGIDQTQTPLHVIDPSHHVLELAQYPVPQAIPTTLYLGDNASLTASAPVDAPPDSGSAQTQQLAEDTLFYTGLTKLCSRSLLEQWFFGLPDWFLWSVNRDDPCASSVKGPSPGKAYLSEPFTEATVLAGPINATIFATATGKNIALLATVDDVAPDGTAVELSAGGLTGSFRALDSDNTWNTATGEVLMPFYRDTREALQAVTPGQVTRYDVGVRPTFNVFAPGHRLRLRITTGDIPNTIPPPWDIPELLGLYKIQRSAASASRLIVPLAPAKDFIR